MDPKSDNTVETLVFEQKNFVKLIHPDFDSPFDELLIKKWSEAKVKNVFKYNLTKNYKTSKVICSRPYTFQESQPSNKYRMVAHLNEGRVTLRRKPQEMSSIRQPFNDQNFNFTKIKAEEVLFRIKSKDGRTDATVIVNNTPIEFCNSLLVPKLEEKRPQVLTDDALRLAISLVALSKRESFVVGFNSLGAMASVNHQHFHLYYSEEEILIKWLPVKDNILEGWPIECFVFEVKEFKLKQIEECVERVMKIVNHCLEPNVNIAHNLFITRGDGLAIRVFLWVLDPVFGAKDDAEINPAFCEFSGFFICKNQEMFDSIDEDFCVKILKNVKTRTNDLKHLLCSANGTDTEKPPSDPWAKYTHPPPNEREGPPSAHFGPRANFL